VLGVSLFNGLLGGAIDAVLEKGGDLLFCLLKNHQGHPKCDEQGMGVGCGLFQEKNGRIGGQACELLT